MPYIHKWVDPDLYLEHKGVKVYRSYKDDDYDQQLEYHFQVQKAGATTCYEDHMYEFDVRDLVTRDWKGDTHQAIKEAIDRGGRGLLLVATGKEGE